MSMFETQQFKNSKEKLKDITASLQKIVECPICLDTIKIPFKVCGRGHGFCSTCFGDLEKCPTCEDTCIRENTICLKNVLEALPRLCCYCDSGCEDIVEKGSDHELFCGYRLMACPEEVCDVEVPLMKLMDHYRNSHPTIFICEDLTSDLITPYIDPSKSYYEPIPLLLFDNLFWLVTTNDIKRKCLLYFFIATPIGKLKSDYYARVKFENGNFGYMFTIKANVLGSFKTKDFVEDQNTQNGDGYSEEECCMKIPHGALPELKENRGKYKGTFKYRISFFEKAK